MISHGYTPETTIIADLTYEALVEKYMGVEIGGRRILDLVTNIADELGHPDDGLGLEVIKILRNQKKVSFNRGKYAVIPVDA